PAPETVPALAAKPVPGPEPAAAGEPAPRIVPAKRADAPPRTRARRPEPSDRKREETPSKAGRHAPAVIVPANAAEPQDSSDKDKQGARGGPIGRGKRKVPILD